MAEPKTKLTKSSVKEFLELIEDEECRKDCRKIVTLMQKATGAKAKMWGDKIIGFGVRTQKYADGGEREWMKIAFSPRKQNITLYLPEFKGRDLILEKLGKHKVSKACVHIRRLSDVHLPTLNKLLQAAVRHSV